MKKQIVKTGIVTVASLALFGGIQELSSSVAGNSGLTMVAYAASISQDQFNKDLNTMETVRNQSGTYVKSVVTDTHFTDFKDYPRAAYYSAEANPGFTEILSAISREVMGTYDVATKSGFQAGLKAYNQDYQALMTFYSAFSGRFSASDRANLSADIKNINDSPIDDADPDGQKAQLDNKANATASFADDLATAFTNYGQDIKDVGSTNTSAGAKPASKVTVSQKQFDQDLKTMTAVKNLGGHNSNEVIPKDLLAKLRSNPSHAYYSPKDNRDFGSIVNGIGYELNSTYDLSYQESDAAAEAAYRADIKALKTTYGAFKNRFSAKDNNKLRRSLADVNNTEMSDDLADRSEAGKSFATDLQNALDDYGKTVVKVGKYTSKKQSSAKHSSIIKLAAKKSRNHKTVKVTGQAKVYKKANYAQIKLYKGTYYSKLSKKETFSKSVSAPKAKTVKVSAGYYSHGHFTRVTSSKTVHVK